MHRRLNPAVTEKPAAALAERIFIGCLHLHLAPYSTTEDPCENGNDAEAAKTTPQQLQLIRQCTAATGLLTSP